jgi:hypothetical protein
VSFQLSGQTRPVWTVLKFLQLKLKYNATFEGGFFMFSLAKKKEKKIEFPHTKTLLKMKLFPNFFRSR